MKNKQSQIRKQAGNDNINETGERNLLSDIKMGISFYSRIPINSENNISPILSNISPALPFVSLIIGIVPALLLFLALIAGLPPHFAAALAIGVWVLITGAMAEDGLADSFDALFGGHSKAKRLEIFKDSRLGTYGVIALVLYIALKIFALGEIAIISPFASASLWLGASILARSFALYLVLKLPPARNSGASASVGRLTNITFFIGVAFAIILGIIFIAPFVGIVGLILALILIVIFVLFWTWLCNKLLGGQTGDLIGALQALLEIVAVSAFIIAINF